MDRRLTLLTAIAKVIILGLLVLVGAQVVRNVTDTLIAAEHIGTTEAARPG